VVDYLDAANVDRLPHRRNHRNSHLAGREVQAEGVATEIQETMSDFIYNTAVWCGLVTASAIAFLVTLYIGLQLYEIFHDMREYFSRAKNGSDLRDRMYADLHQMDRWCADNDYVVACCERLRKVVDGEPVEHISEWREKIRKIDASGESLLRRLEAKL